MFNADARGGPLLPPSCGGRVAAAIVPNLQRRQWGERLLARPRRPIINSNGPAGNCLITKALRVLAAAFALVLANAAVAQTNGGAGPDQHRYRRTRHRTGGCHPRQPGRADAVRLRLGLCSCTEFGGYQRRMWYRPRGSGRIMAWRSCPRTAGADARRTSSAIRRCRNWPCSNSAAAAGTWRR